MKKKLISILLIFIVVSSVAYAFSVRDMFTKSREVEEEDRDTRDTKDTKDSIRDSSSSSKRATNNLAETRGSSTKSDTQTKTREAQSSRKQAAREDYAKRKEFSGDSGGRDFLIGAYSRLGFSNAEGYIDEVGEVYATEALQDYPMTEYSDQEEEEESNWYDDIPITYEGHFVIPKVIEFDLQFLRTDEGKRQYRIYFRLDTDAGFYENRVFDNSGYFSEDIEDAIGASPIENFYVYFDDRQEAMMFYNYVVESLKSYQGNSDLLIKSYESVIRFRTDRKPWISEYEYDDGTHKSAYVSIYLTEDSYDVLSYEIFPE